MHHQSIVYIIFLIFTGTAVLGTIALLTRQSLLVAYIVLGAILGPWGFKLVSDSVLIRQTGDIGIIFLLFLLGLHLQPQNLLHSLRKMSLITLASSTAFLLVGFTISHLFGYGLYESITVGAAMMFSSTIIGLKLLPTTVLHHQHTGELMISILLLQDLIAIGLLLILQGTVDKGVSMQDVLIVAGSLPLLLLVAYLFQHFLLGKLLMRFDRIQEYIFLLSIGWCLSMAELAHFMGLSEEIGAFIAGITIATNPVSLFIAERLKPLRDFFLVMFFFTIGARFNFGFLPEVAAPAIILALLILLFKPIIFNGLLRSSGEAKKVSWEISVRLGQASEFSLLIVQLATDNHLISESASYMVQAATILTFIVSCYWVVIRFPTPMATTEALRRD